MFKNGNNKLRKSHTRRNKTNKYINQSKEEKDKLRGRDKNKSNESNIKIIKAQNTI